MSEQHQRALEAALEAYYATHDSAHSRERVNNAIRAYQAAMASALPADIPSHIEAAYDGERNKAPAMAGCGDLSMNPDLYDEGGNLKHERPSAVPEDVREVVNKLRDFADRDNSRADWVRREWTLHAASLLEQQSGQIELLTKYGPPEPSVPEDVRFYVNFLMNEAYINAENNAVQEKLRKAASLLEQQAQEIEELKYEIEGLKIVRGYET
jgi:hypothetical protein